MFILLLMTEALQSTIFEASNAKWLLEHVFMTINLKEIN